MGINSVAIIGGGLAGCECAFALAEAGVRVHLFEMKPERFSAAHVSSGLAELVCSNSFRSDALDSAVGELKAEMRCLGSLSMAVAAETRVPAGKALAVDRSRFTAEMTSRIQEHGLISVERREVHSVEADARLGSFDAVVVAAGPLAGEGLVESLSKFTGENYLYFYDAIAPAVDGASIDMNIAFWGARYHPEDQDYLNCPMDEDEYRLFYEALVNGKTFKAREFEDEVHFEGCMPVEALAARGFKTLVFGPLKPVGFTDPRTGRRPYALLQLRAENVNKTVFNLVGCQTKLTYPEQKRIFRMIPGLEKAEFPRFGSMHRNTFVNAPRVLAWDLSLNQAPHVYLAGQITGVEGYVESAACGLWLGKHLARKASGAILPPPPVESAMGALLGHLRTPAKHFQPSNVQFGLMPELGVRAGKANRKAMYAERARRMFLTWLDENSLNGDRRYFQLVPPDEGLEENI